MAKEVQINGIRFLMPDEDAEAAPVVRRRWNGADLWALVQQDDAAARDMLRLLDEAQVWGPRDSEFMRSVAAQARVRRYLTERQMECVRRGMHRYLDRMVELANDRGYERG